MVSSTKVLIKEEKEEKKHAKTRKLSILEGGIYSLTEGFGLKNITPYALALGAKNSHIGFLGSVPSFIGTLSQLISIRLMNKFTRKQIILAGAILQAIMFIPIMLLGYFYFIKGIKSVQIPLLLIIFYTFLVTAGSFISPVWNSLMKDNVTNNQGRYFGRRVRFCDLISLISMITGGILLDYAKMHNVYFGFLIAFSIAFTARIASSVLLSKMYEPILYLEEESYFSFTQFVRKMPFNNFGKFVLFVTVFYFAVGICSPFFSVYMLKYLNFSYLKYFIIIVTSLLARVLFTPLWGKVVDKYGNIKVIKITSFFIPFVPLLWILSLNIENDVFLVSFLFLVEFFSGFFWSGFDISVGTFIYNAVTKQRMALCVSYYNILTSVGLMAGAVLGGFLSENKGLVFGHGYIIVIFFLSGLARLVTSLTLTPLIKEIREVKDISIVQVKRRLMRLTPEQVLNYLDIRVNRPKY